MKKLIFMLFFVVNILIISCKKSNVASGEIYGTWKLTETLSDPGDGSGKYIKVKGEPKYITIEKSGKIEGDAMPDFRTFRILDSVKMEITTRNYVMPITYRYKATTTTLTLNPPCIEACGLRFIRQ